ncbi:MAG TPA: HAMP domain-containing sensor histidine kinase [Nocardioidaceae bacterium]|nr:HAMP domain-containing sensor histidine kinase [Nocardioidaceae bacterium]
MQLHYKRSLASRVAVLATMAVGISVAIVALAAFFTVRHQLRATMDDSLLSRATAAAQYDALTNPALQNIPPAMLGAADVKVGYVTANGVVHTTSRGPRDDQVKLGAPEFAVARGLQRQSIRTISTPGADYRVATVPTRQPGLALVIAQSLEPNEHTLAQLALVLFGFGALGVIAAGFAGWAVARNGLRPVRRLTAATEEIARTEQLDPIAVEGSDEIARLATAFNAMLAALSASRIRQRQLVSDAGHELRTPLTSLRTNLDLLSQAETKGGLSPASRGELMDDVRFQIDELTTLIGDLTELAREDAAPAEPELVDLAEVTDRAVQRVRRRAGGLDFDVRTDTWWVSGDPAALERAITNLLDNAAKWSPPLGVVTVRLAEGSLLVADEGHGIAEADLPHVFERFYRSADSRTMPGSGLGLSIVRKVAERHGGTVRADRSERGGAALWLELPGRPGRAAETLGSLPSPSQS